MTRIKLLSAGLIVVAMFVTPATAREHFSAERHLSEGVNANASSTRRYDDERARIPAPPVGAVAVTPQSESDGACDVGDNPMIC
jgi:hypothetical protein